MEHAPVGPIHEERRTPRWVWAVVLCLALAEPAVHGWIGYFPPEGVVPTGLHGPDSPYYLTSIRMFRSGFESPYAGPDAPYGTHSFRYYILAPYVMYGITGHAFLLAGLSTFMTLGILNGLGMGAYLLGVYWLLREAVPRRANLTFLLFALGGGVGGVLYILTGAAGLHDAPQFDAYFRRFAVYELFEGPHLFPITHAARLYYTVSLAGCFGGFAALLRARKTGRNVLHAAGMVLLCIGGLINLRYGFFMAVVGGIYFACAVEKWPERIAWTARLAVPLLLGGFVSWLTVQAGPNLTENTLQNVRQSMWLTPFLTAAIFLLIPAASEVKRTLASLSGVKYWLAWALLGYLGAFAALFAAYQTYYGNWLIARDGVVADAISDWALPGIVLGLLAGAWRKKERESSPENAWPALWLLLFLATAISAFGHGRFGYFGPQRLLVFLGIPLAILAAAAIQRWRAMHPRLANGSIAVIVGCGVCTVTVSTLCFLGPLDHAPGSGPFAEIHTEIMTPEDARLLEHFGEGMVLAPPPFGDIIAQQPGNRSVFGLAMIQTGRIYGEMEAKVARFFAEDTPADVREALLREQNVDYVYCPDTWPVTAESREELRALPFLEEVAEAGRGVLFRVQSSEFRE